MADRDIEELLQVLTLPNALAARSDAVDVDVRDDATIERMAQAAARFAKALDTPEPVRWETKSVLSASLEDGYSQANATFEAGDFRRAAITLLGLVGQPAIANDISLALAICATRLGHFDMAHDLAQASFEGGLRHPRALCILGLCELVRGNKVSAQGRLALAARLARGQPAYREDMRTAQKLLLLRHIG